jgi:hypothetical protein
MEIINSIQATTRGRVSVSNISETGSGRLRFIHIQDSAVATNFNATITINVDGTGNQVIALNTMFKSGEGAGESIGGKTDFVRSTSGASADTMKLELGLNFRSSLVVSVSGADGFLIVWDEDV